MATENQKNPLLNWNATDVVKLRQYLTENPKFLMILNDRVPKCEGGTRDEAANSGMKAQGCRDIIDVILHELATDQQHGSPSSDFLPTP